MKKIYLNTKKIKDELIRLGKNQSWLAGKLKMTRQNVSYMLTHNSLRAAEKIGDVLGIEPKDLLK